jgi:hypothetical protein
MLNDSQRVSLRIAFRLIDERMREIEAILERPEEVGVMYEVRDDLSPAMRERLPEKISAVRAILKNLRDRLALSAEITTARREAFKGLPYLWEVLEESTSKRLRRYGAVDDRLARILDPQIQSLETLIIELEHILNGTQGTKVSEASGSQA